MNSIFKILSSHEWDEAKITGIIPRCSADEENNCVHVNEYQDLGVVCGSFYKPSDYPVALEFAPDAYAGDLKWLDANKEKPWREGQLKIDNLLADLVLNIYSFEHQQSDDGFVFSLQGES